MVTRFLALTLLLVAGQWQVTWHALEHLPTATATAQAGERSDGHLSATTHCEHCAPVQIALPPTALALYLAPAEPCWRAPHGGTNRSLAVLTGYHSRAPPLSA